MLNDFRKSIQSILYERVRSPFSGAFFFSWIVWNWKLIYYLLFGGAPITGRIEFVEENYINLYNNLIYPFASTVFLIVLYPFITTAGYWIWLKFKTWQTDIRNEIEKTQRLSIEESLEIKMIFRNQEIEIEKILRKKDEEILLLKKQLGENTESEEEENVTTHKPKKDEYLNEFFKFQKSNYYDDFKVVIHAIMSRNTLSDPMIDPTAVAYYESNGIIKRDTGLLYLFTEKGLTFVKFFLDKLRRT